jgi:hypothetical protein
MGSLSLSLSLSSVWRRVKYRSQKKFSRVVILNFDREIYGRSVAGREERITLKLKSGKQVGWKLSPNSI